MPYCSPEPTRIMRGVSEWAYSFEEVNSAPSVDIEGSGVLPGGGDGGLSGKVEDEVGLRLCDAC